MREIDRVAVAAGPVRVYARPGGLPLAAPAVPALGACRNEFFRPLIPALFIVVIAQRRLAEGLASGPVTG